MEFTCPGCAGPMARVRRGRVSFWGCQSCGAHAITIPSLRGVMPEEVWSEVWPPLRRAAAKGARGCPSCTRRMDQTPVIAAAGGMRLDICDPCGVVYLDPAELQLVPKRPVEDEKKPPPELAQAIARAQVAIMNAEYDAREFALFEPFKEFASVIFFALARGIARGR